jgi:hypothetical protein
VSRPRGDRTIVVFDLDGTVSDDSERGELYGPWRIGSALDRETAWTTYYEALVDDPPIEPMFQIADSFASMGFSLVVATGRPERYRQHTVQWLMRHGFPACSTVLMRRNYDRRKNPAIKFDHAKIIGPERIALWVDDHPEVPAALAPLAIPVLSLGNPVWDEGIEDPVGSA